jgi:hypothetical protein
VAAGERIEYTAFEECFGQRGDSLMSQTIPVAAGVPAEFPNGSPLATHETMLQRARRILAGDIREEDYLPMTDDVRKSVALSEAYVRDEKKGELIGQARLEHIQYLLLSYHCGGKCILSYQDGTGVVVLAVSEEIREVLDSLSKEQLLRVCVQSPEEW